MKKIIQLTLMSLLFLVLISPALADESTEPLELDVESLAASSQEDPAALAVPQPTSTNHCLSQASGCSPGTSNCNGKAYLAPCGIGKVCFPTCFVPSGGAVCSCLSLPMSSTASSSLKLEEFLARLNEPELTAPTD